MLHGRALPRRKDVTEGEELHKDDDHVSPGLVGMTMGHFSTFSTLGSGRMIQARRVLCTTL